MITSTWSSPTRASAAAGSFVNDTREEWERTFAVDWCGVYHCARAFLPLLIASGDGVLVNTSSVNGLWAALGPGMPNTAYSAAKFAVQGFTEALIEDLRSNAPQVRVAVVMPGHVGTDIIGNTLRAHGKDPEQMIEAELVGTGTRWSRPVCWPRAHPPRTPGGCFCRGSATSGTRRRSARPRRPRSSSTECAPGPGGSSSARTPR